MKVLIADDEPLSRRLARAALATEGYEILEVSDGAAALHALQGDAPPPVAILDWVMPGLPGTEICRRLRARADGVPPHLILVTSRERTEDIVTGLEAGADDYLAKPFMPEELRARVRVGVRVWTLQQRLAAQVEELQAALAHVNRLQGLLPICAYCKKIRNEQNYWQQVEGYIADNSDATFTHGICPDCEEKVREEIRRLTAERRAMGTAP